MKNLNEMLKEEYEELRKTVKEKLDEKTIILYSNENGVRKCQLLETKDTEECINLIEKHVGKFEKVDYKESPLAYWIHIWFSPDAKGDETLNGIRGNIIITSSIEENSPMPMSFQDIEETIKYFAKSSTMNTLEYLTKVVYEGETVEY